MGKLGDFGFDFGADSVGSLLDFGLNQLSSSINSSRNYKYWKKQTDYEQKLALENWNRQNEYNAPKSQMQRYAEAGLNPNLIYGQQNTVGSVDLQGSSSVNTESSQRLQRLGFMSAYENAKQMRAQTSLIKQQTLTEANNTLMRGLEVVSKQIENKYKEMKEKGETDTLKQELENLKVLHAKILEDTKKVTSDISVNDSTIGLNKSRIGLVDAQTADVAENRKTENAKVDVARQANKETARHNVQMEQIQKDYNLNEQQIKQMKEINAQYQLKLQEDKQKADSKLRELELHYKNAPQQALEELSDYLGIPLDKIVSIDKALNGDEKRQGVVNSLFIILKMLK